MGFLVKLGTIVLHKGTFGIMYSMLSHKVIPKPLLNSELTKLVITFDECDYYF